MGMHDNKCDDLTTSGINRNAKGGKRNDLGFYVRSKWEANYARYLKWLENIGEIARWEYEPDTFEFPIRRGTKFYTPDFKVFDSDGTYEYHEVKGWMNQRSKTQLKRMTKYYPDERVIVIDSDAYYALAKDVKRLVDNWE